MGEPLEIRSEQWPGILASYQRALGNYDWLLRLAVWRRRQTGWFPMNLYPYLKRCVNPRNPYFIGRTSQGVPFLGDAREYDSWRWAVGHPSDDRLIKELITLRRDHPGGYLDVGANCGIVAASVTQQTPSQLTVAFEPVPSTARRAAATFALNKLVNARLFQVAIGDADSEIKIYEKPGHSGGASAIRSDDSVSAVLVPLRRLDSLIPSVGLGRISLIKIDVEGFEPKVLSGAAVLLAEQRPAVVYEWNESSEVEVPNRRWTIKEANELVERFGGRYQFRGFGHDGNDVQDVVRYNGNHVDVICTPTL